MIRRGHLVMHEPTGQCFVPVTTDSLASVLPTVWALVASPDRGPLRPPLVIPIHAGVVGDQPALWIRATQIRTVAASGLRDLGQLPRSVVEQIDELLPRLLALSDGR